MKYILSLMTILLPFWSYSQVPSIHRNAEIEAMVQEVSSESLENYVREMVAFGTRHSLSDSTSQRGIEAARQYVLSKFKSFEAHSGGRLQAEIDYFDVKADGRRIPKDVKMGNVMATLQGSNPDDDRIFIVSGHLDSRISNIMDKENDAPGANDDGSGVAAVIELARIMSQHSFSATVVFLAVSGEEQGLKGAEYLAKKAQKENWNIAAMINNDMIGNSFSNQTLLNDNTRLRVFSEGVPLYETEQMAAIRRYTNAENDSKSRQLARYIKEVGERYVDQLEVKLIYRNDRFLRGGDHIPFSREGFTAVRLCEYNENYHHQHQDVRKEGDIQFGDLLEFVDYEYLRKNTAVNLAVLTSLAKAPSIPQNVGTDVRQLDNTSTLRWESPSTGNAQGYYVLMRETSSPMWEKKFYTEDREITLPYSKDNYFFAVQAVGDDGAESLAVFPQPITQ